MLSSSRAPRQAVAGVVLALLLAVSSGACSDDPGDPVAGPGTAGTAGATQGSTAGTGAGTGQGASRSTPSRVSGPASRTGPPRLQKRPEARAIQRWAAAFAEVVNAEDEDFSAAAATMTEAGLERMAFYTRREWGRHFPGPLPVTVVGIPEPNAEGVTMVRACAWIAGWSQRSETDTEREPREVVSVVIGVVQEDGRWRVDGMGSRDRGSCAGVDVPGRARG